MHLGGHPARRRADLRPEPEPLRACRRRSSATTAPVWQLELAELLLLAAAAVGQWQQPVAVAAGQRLVLERVSYGHWEASPPAATTVGARFECAAARGLILAQARGPEVAGLGPGEARRE